MKKYNSFKEALRYIFNVVILFNTVFYLKLNFKLKIEPKKNTVLIHLSEHVGQDFSVNMYEYVYFRVSTKNIFL